MNQFELERKSKANPEPGDSWLSVTPDGRLIQKCLVLRGEVDGKVVITDTIRRDHNVWEWRIDDAHEVTIDEFKTLVGDTAVARYPDHYLIKKWSGSFKQKEALKPVVSTFIDHRITGRYIDMLVANGNTPRVDPEGTLTNGNHLLWMLLQIYNNKLSSETKAHRWLGFIQGGLISLGLTTVLDERNFTRDIFNGA